LKSPEKENGDSVKKGDMNNIESDFYYALGHDIRRRIIKIIGISGFTSFTKLKKELQVSTGTIYHHLDTLSKLIEQKENKKYYLTDLGELAFSSLENNKREFELSENSKKGYKFPIITNISSFFSKIIDPEKKINNIYIGIFSTLILILGIIFSEISQFYSILLFFRQIGAIDLPFLSSLIYILNFFIFFFLTELLSRLFYRKKKNIIPLLLTFPVVLLPMDFYLIIHSIFTFLGITEGAFVYFIDKMLLVFFQAISILFLTYILGEIKELRLENGFIIALLIHLTGFTILILFISF